MITTKKIEHSIELLRKAEKLALLMNEEGYYLAFSGGSCELLSKLYLCKFIDNLLLIRESAVRVC